MLFPTKKNGTKISKNGKCHKEKQVSGISYHDGFQPPKQLMFFSWIRKNLSTTHRDAWSPPSPCSWNCSPNKGQLSVRQHHPTRITYPVRYQLTHTPRAPVTRFYIFIKGRGRGKEKGGRCTFCNVSQMHSGVEIVHCGWKFWIFIKSKRTCKKNYQRLKNICQDRTCDGKLHKAKDKRHIVPNDVHTKRNRQKQTSSF